MRTVYFSVTNLNFITGIKKPAINAGFLLSNLVYSDYRDKNRPAIVADIKFDNVPAATAFIPILAMS